MTPNIYRENVALKSKVWGSLTLAQLYTVVWREREERGVGEGVEKNDTL